MSRLILSERDLKQIRSAIDHIRWRLEEELAACDPDEETHEERWMRELHARTVEVQYLLDDASS